MLALVTKNGSKVSNIINSRGPRAKEALRDASGDAEQAASAIIEGFEA